MEAPSPLNINNTSKPYEEDIAIINKIVLKSENKDYEMSLGIKKSNNLEFLIIKIKEVDEIKNCYQINISFEDLIKMSKGFRFFDTIKDILIFIEKKAKEKEIILSKNLDFLKFEFKINLPDGKEDIISLELKKTNLDYMEIIYQLTVEVENLKKKLLAQNEKIWEEINGLKEENKKLKEENIKLSNKLNDYIEKKTKLTIDSKIVKEYEINFIINYLKNNDNYLKDKNLSFNLIYRGSRDGDNSIKVHEFCDKKQNCIFIILSEEGNIFGGYSKIGWESRPSNKPEYPNDDNAFLFSVNKNKIYPVKKNKKQVCWIEKENFALCFYGSCVIYNNFMSKKINVIGNQILNNFEGMSSSNELNGKNMAFKISEYEVFQLLIE